MTLLPSCFVEPLTPSQQVIRLSRVLLSRVPEQASLSKHLSRARQASLQSTTSLRTQAPTNAIFRSHCAKRPLLIVEFPGHYAKSSSFTLQSSAFLAFSPSSVQTREQEVSLFASKSTAALSQDARLLCESEKDAADVLPFGRSPTVGYPRYGDRDVRLDVFQPAGRTR